MPVFERLVASLLADKTSFVRKGLDCPECLPVRPCMGHWKLDDEDWITNDEFLDRSAAMGKRLERGLATMEWDRLIGAAWVYANMRGGRHEELNGGDLFLAMTEPTTWTVEEPHYQKMKARWPILFTEDEKEKLPEPKPGLVAPGDEEE